MTGCSSHTAPPYDLLYNEPLCRKCLHAEQLHTEVVSQLGGGAEVRRCTVGICSCVLKFSDGTRGKSL